MLLSSSHRLFVQAVVVLIFTLSSASAQLLVFQNQTPDHLVRNILLGPAVTVDSITFDGYPGSSIPPGEVGQRFGRFNGVNSNLGLAGGVILFTGDATYAIGPNDEETVGAGGIAFNPTPDRDLCQLAGIQNCDLPVGAGRVYNRSVLEFDLTPANDMVSFRYVFSSEEYERWTCMEFNDAFGFFLSGPGISGPFENNAMNIAFVPGSLAPVSVNTVNSGMTANNANSPDPTDPFAGCTAQDPDFALNTPYYTYNGSWVQGVLGGAQTEPPYCCDPYYIEHNGLTVVLTASAAVQIGETYHIKMAIGNISDWRLPSAVYIEQGSFACGDRFTLTVDDGPNVNITDEEAILYESDTDSIHLRFNRWGGFYLDEYLRIAVEGTAMEGTDYLPVLPDSIHFNQLDSAVVFTIAIPVRSDDLRQLTIHLITSNGDKVMSYDMTIAPEGMTGAEDMAPAPRAGLSAFPTPVQDILHVALAPGAVEHTELHVFDMTGRMVMQQAWNGATSITVDIGHLPNGLYTVWTNGHGQRASTRISVHH